MSQPTERHGVPERAAFASANHIFHILVFELGGDANRGILVTRPGGTHNVGGR